MHIRLYCYKSNGKMKIHINHILVDIFRISNLRQRITTKIEG
jgi:hypothetical protein